MKLKPREKRERLFKNGRPLIRTVQFIDGQDYARDIKILWVAHTKKKWYFLPEDITQEEFLERILELSERASFFIADDTNSSYNEGKGPVIVFWAFDDGWKVEPHIEIFPWATKRNILRVVVSFLHMMKYKKIGVCVIYSLKNSLALCEKCVEYGVLFKSGMIANGDPRGDEFIYSIRGKK
jgi:hypothetical protein